MKIIISQKPPKYQSLMHQPCRNGDWFISEDGSCLAVVLDSAVLAVLKTDGKALPVMVTVATAGLKYAPCDVQIEAVER